MRLKILSYKPLHRDSVIEIIQEATRFWGGSWNKFILELYSQKFKPDLHTFRYSVFTGDSIIATFILKREVDACVPYFLAVRKDMRGKGAGSKIISFIERFAKRKKLKLLRIDTAHEFRKNLHFYLNAGFKKIGKAQNFYMLGDKQIFLYKKIK